MERVKRLSGAMLLVLIANCSIMPARDLGQSVTSIRRDIAIHAYTEQSLAREAYHSIRSCDVPVSIDDLRVVMSRAGCPEVEMTRLNSAWVYFLVQTNAVHMSMIATFDLYIAAMVENMTDTGRIVRLESQLRGTVRTPLTSILSSNHTGKESMLADVLNDPGMRTKVRPGMSLDTITITYDVDRYRHRVVWPYRYFITMTLSDAEGRQDYRIWIAVLSDMDNPEYNPTFPASFREGDPALRERVRWLGWQGF